MLDRGELKNHAKNQISGNIGILNSLVVLFPQDAAIRHKFNFDPLFALAVFMDAGMGIPALEIGGVLEIQADAVEAAYMAQGYAKAERILRGEWAALIFRGCSL